MPKSPLANFEKQYGELEKIVKRMESGELSLDQSLKDFERGMKLCGDLREALSQAEQKVQILVERNQTESLEDFPGGDETE